MAKKGSPFDEYDMLEQIGNGSFGSVHRAQHKIDNRVVSVGSFFSCLTSIRGVLSSLIATASLKLTLV
jgi:serine/threonine protein kinase